MTVISAGEVAAALIAVLGLLAIVGGWLRWIRPRWRQALDRVSAALDTIAGREAITDNITGRELAPALPSIGRRMESVEGSVSRLVEVIEGQHEQNQRLDNHETRITQHDDRIAQLESQVIERIAAKAESVSAWRAVEAVAKQADPPEVEP